MKWEVSESGKGFPLLEARGEDVLPESLGISPVQLAPQTMD